ncbi:MAG TPA: nitroreductase family protein [Polyangiaceae bacterium]|nr:nitroreductase family protein [Polyangiaceae bacterium]
MDLKQAIRARHAVRSYKRQTVEEQDVHRLLEAAVRAPNARNEQPWSFAIVQNRDLLERYSEQTKALLLSAATKDSASPASRALLRSQSFDVFHGAGTLIVICGRTDDEHAEADCWLAAENLMLTACDLGLGSCPVGSAASILNSGRVKAELYIPREFSAIAPIVVGYADEAAALPTPRAAPRILSFRR